MTGKEEVIEIDFKQLVRLLWKRLWIIVLASLLAGGGAFAYTYYFVTPLYQSSVKLYVNNTSISLGSSQLSISSSELMAAQSLVDTYIVILETRMTLNEVVQEAGLNYTVDELNNMISASAVNGTEIFEVVVTSDDPAEAENIANTIANVLPEKISNIVDGSSVRVVDYAVAATHCSSPNYAMNAAIGALAGMVLSIAAIIAIGTLDDIVRSEDYLLQTYGIPVLAAIPDMNNQKSGAGYGEYCEKQVSPAVVNKNRD